METRTAVTAGLFLAWLVHDSEELLTMPAQSRRLLARVPAAVPLPPDLREQGLSREHVAVAIGLVGLATAGAAAEGWRTGGRSTVFRTALDAFGLHALGHLGASAATRGYTTGVVTASTVVLPYWLWAGRRLAAEGVPGRSSRRGVLLLGPLVWGAHVAAAVVVRRRRGAARQARPTEG